MSKKFKVSNSRIKCWRKCHNKHYYRYVMKIEKKRKNVNLAVGSMFHDCMEKIFDKKSVVKTINIYKLHLAKLMDEERVIYEEKIETGAGMILNYMEKYKDDDFEVLAIELEIEYELMDGVIFDGYIDKVLRDDHGDIIMMEHKTCKTIPEESVRLSDIQTLLYHDGMVKCGHDAPREVIWDYARKKVPHIPEVLKKGDSLSKNMRIDTTYEVYLKEIMKNKFKVSEYKEILSNLKSKPDTFFRRIKLPVSKHQVDLVVDDAKRTALEIKHLGEFERTRNFDYQCGSMCDYYQLCLAETLNVETDFILKKQYTERTNGKDKKDKKDPF